MAKKNPVVLVTGGAQGIGMAVSRAFAEAGACVCLADLDLEAGEELTQALAARGASVLFQPTDVAVEGDVQRLVTQIVDAWGRVDVVVNNAGIGDHAGLLDRPMEQWDRVLAVNLRGPYMVVRYAVPHMPAGSAVVNIASTRALMSEPDTEPYAASKGGLLALTHALAVSLAPRRIRVNAISPGWIDVSSWKKRASARQEVLRPQDHAQHPVGRVGVPRDIAEAVRFLADGDRSGFITGTNLVVDGGMTVKMIYEP